MYITPLLQLVVKDVGEGALVEAQFSVDRLVTLSAVLGY